MPASPHAGGGGGPGRCLAATASRVLRGDAKVSEQRPRTPCSTAAQAISYVPNLAARSLVTGRSDSVAFLVEETEERMFSDPFFLGMLRSAQEAVAGGGAAAGVHGDDPRPRTRTRFLRVRRGRARGRRTPAVAARPGPAARSGWRTLGVPTVLSGRPLSGRRRLWYVDADNVGGGRLATRTCSRPGAGTSPPSPGRSTCAPARTGWPATAQAVERRRPCRTTRAWSSVGDFTSAGGYAAMRRLLEQRPDVDAVFAASDLAAFGAMRAIAASAVAGSRRRRGGDRLRRHPGRRRAAAAADHGPAADRRARAPR